MLKLFIHPVTHFYAYLDLTTGHAFISDSVLAHLLCCHPSDFDLIIAKQRLKNWAPDADFGERLLRSDALIVLLIDYLLEAKLKYYAVTLLYQVAKYGAQTFIYKLCLEIE